MKTRLRDQVFRYRRRLTLTNEVRVNQRLIDGDATQGNTDEEKYPN